MNRLFIIVAAFVTAPFLSFSQNEVQPYGKVDNSDLELKECSFEKDANAMVLFDRGDLYFDTQFDILLERHKRIKIFNEKAKDEANIRIVFYSINRYEEIFDVSAQTINLKDGKAVITKLDRKQIFREVVDKYKTAIVFTFPDVQAGSVLEFKYKWKTPALGNFPSWTFQSDLPTRYSEIQTATPDMFFYKTDYRLQQEIFKDKKSAQSKTLTSGPDAQGYIVDVRTIGLKDVPSLKDEPFMTCRYDNLQRASFELTRIQPIGGFTRTGNDTWAKVAGDLSNDEDFGLQFRKKLDGEEEVILKAKALPTDDKKIAFVFGYVKNAMKWNGYDNCYANDGTPKAWQKKTGNSAEINLILYRLLKQAGVKDVFPMIVSTKENGKVNIAFPSLSHFNRTVVHIPVDSVKRYVLDATDKYNLYNVTPSNLLNSYGVSIDRENKQYKIINIENEVPIRKNIYVQAEIKPEGKMTGQASVSDYGYHKISAVRNYTVSGEEKYKELLTGKENSFKIKALKLEGLDVDSLPLQEQIDFELELSSADENYIYFTPNLFSGLRTNPLIAESRRTLLDFGYNNKYTITGQYKLPAGFKPDALPKNINFVMPDKSIAFQRMVVVAEDNITVRLVVDYKKTVYGLDEYPMLREFYKQMYEMLNEQIVLKKS